MSSVPQSFKNCSNDFGKLSDVASIFSFVLASITFIVLIRQPRFKKFPHNLAPFITLSIAILCIGRASGYLLKDELEASSFLCWITGFLTAFGVLAVRFWWMASLIVLYLVIVKRHSVKQIQRSKHLYYGSVAAILTVILFVPFTWTNITYSKSRGRCWYNLSPDANFFLFNVHGIVAAILFLCVGPPVIKTMLSSENKEMLTSSRAQMLWEEAVRQVLLGFVMFSMTVIATFRAIHYLVFSHSDEKDTAFLENTAYSSCAAAYVFFGFVGIAISLIYLVNRKNYEALCKTIRKAYSRMCGPASKKPSSLDNIEVNVDDLSTSPGNAVQPTDVAVAADDQNSVVNYAQSKTPTNNNAGRPPPSPRTLLHSQTIYDGY